MKNQVRILAGLRGYASKMQKAARANHKDVCNYLEIITVDGADWAIPEAVMFQQMRAHNSAIARRYLLRVLALQAMDVS